MLPLVAVRETVVPERVLERLIALEPVTFVPVRLIVPRVLLEEVVIAPAEAVRF